MIHIVSVKTAAFDFFRSQILGQLFDDGADHLHMRQFFRSDIRQQPRYFPVRHGVSLREIAQGGGQLPVRPAKLRDDDLGGFRVTFCDLHRILQSFFIIPHLIKPPFPGPGLRGPFPDSSVLAAKLGQGSVFVFVFRGNFMIHPVHLTVIVKRIRILRMGI